MRSNLLAGTFFLLLLCAAALPLLGEQNKLNRERVEELKANAGKGDALAQFELGGAYDFGLLSLAKDGAEAVKWYRRAAEQNNAWAQCFLGICYNEGRGVAKDYTEAVKWFRKAAESNDAVAQFYLGVCYDFGKGVRKDNVEAVKWYRKAAEQGNACAQYNLGLCYADGRGVKKDAVEAVKWYQKAADQNVVEAQRSLAFCYANGQGVLRDQVHALRWVKKVAEHGDPESQVRLGIAYETGEGVLQNYIEAYKWFNLAAAQGEINAIMFRSWVAKKMTPEQIAEAQKLSSEFKPRKTSNSENSNSIENPTASGSGFFITDDGYLITNEHVVKDAAQVRLVTSAGLISARVVKVDAANDLALLKAEGKFSSMPIAPSRAVKLGGTVATVGFPNIGLQGFAPKFARGEIASLSGAADDARYFQISVPVQPGNSGGALVDERGNVVGVVSAKLNAAAALQSSGALPENVNYAVKSSYLLSFLESVPEVSAKLKEANTKEVKFEEVVEQAKQAAVLVLVY
ncbi:MAG: tetratricopeptide repeat-containing serine protease family protein [Verrucomicrobiota bacterium]